MATFSSPGDVIETLDRIELRKDFVIRADWAHTSIRFFRFLRCSITSWLNSPGRVVDTLIDEKVAVFRLATKKSANNQVTDIRWQHYCGYFSALRSYASAGTGVDQGALGSKLVSLWFSGGLHRPARVWRLRGNAVAMDEAARGDVRWIAH